MTLPKKFPLACAIALFTIGLVFAPTAHAATIIAIDDPSTLGIDLVLGDPDLDGVISTGGFISVGGFPLSLTLGIGNPGASRLDLSTIAGSFEEGAALNLLLTQTDYTGSGLASSSIAGSTDGNLVYAAYFDPSNAPFGLANLIGDPLTFNSMSFSGATSAFIPGFGPYSLTQAISLTHGAGQPAVTQLSASIQVTPVPEPATMTLLGLGLAGAALGRCKKTEAF